MGTLRNFLKRIILWKRNVKISHNVDIANTDFGNYCNVAHHAQISNSNVGKRTSIGRYSKIQNADIGKYCSISWDVTIGAVSHPINSVSMHAFSYRKQFGICGEDFYLEHKRVIIGNDVWVGCNVVILPGVKIGTGAVVGAGSVVTKDVDSYEVVAGNPAKHLKYRFASEVREKLLSTEWWNFSDKVIKENMQIFHYGNNLNTNSNILEQLLKIKVNGGD